MVNPTLEEVLQYRGCYNIVPVWKEMLADTDTPISIYQRFQDEAQSFLLESVEGGVKWARYSFIGLKPFLVIWGKNGEGFIKSADGIQAFAGNPVEQLAKCFKRLKRPPERNGPRFMGGAVGYFGYDAIRYYERIPEAALDDRQMADIHFMFMDQLIIFDHLKQQIRVCVNLHVDENDTDEKIAADYFRAEAQIEQLIERMMAPKAEQRLQLAKAEIAEDELVANVTRQQFEENVRKAKAYIAAGDIFQVVLSQRFEIETSVDPLTVYRVLRVMNPSPYMYDLKFGSERIVGTSPELLVRVEDGVVETMPIAGTRPRGKDETEDARLAEELLADPKERAEHTMLVDLGRNDLGRVCRYGTVETAVYMAIEKYSHVMHLVSHVKGELAPHKTPFDALFSCLPAGTVSGAPKVRAMEIIAELEKEARGAYAGAIGYLDFNGNLDTCITIRTIVFQNGKAYVQAGAGIVADSDPAREYEETVNKAKAFLTALKIAEKMEAKEEVR